MESLELALCRIEVIYALVKLDMRCGSNSHLDCSLLLFTPGKLLVLASPANSLWQALDLPRKVTAWSFVRDAMHVDGVAAALHNVTFIHPIDVVKIRTCGFVRNVLLHS